MALNKSVYLLDYIILKFSNHPERIFSGLTSNTLDKEKNAFIDNIGRTVTAFFQLKKDEDMYIAFPKKNYEKLMAHLEKSLKLTKVKIEKTDYNVYFTFKKEKAELVFSDNIIAAKKELKSISEEEFNLYRLKNNIPLPGIDFNHEMMLNVSEEFVSYSKGCYLGQEVIARVKYLGKPPKKLAVTEGEKVTSKAVIDGEVKGFGFVKN